MELYHVFKNKESCFLYLADFKQLFEITESEFNELRDRDKNKDNIVTVLNNYKKHLTEQDQKTIKPCKDTNRYGLFLCSANICNACCTYCFAGQGDYGKETGLMDFQTAKKSVDFFMKKVPLEKSGSIIFFGGEPLLAYDLLKQVCEYIKENYKNRRYSFSIVTNATLLTPEMIDYLAENNFDVGISIDGGEYVQNIQRPLRNNNNSFYEATKHLNYVFEKIKSVHARGTFANFDISLVKAYEDLINIGFKEVSIPPDILNEEMNKEFDKLLNQLDELYDYIIDYISKNEDFPFGLFVTKIRSIFTPKFDIQYSCGLGRNVFSIDVDGNIYPCHRFSSEEEFVLGNVNNRELKTMDYESFECKKCWDQYTCSHGCAYNDYMLTGDMETKNIYWCKYSKKLTELSLSLINELSQKQLENILLKVN